MKFVLNIKRWFSIMQMSVLMLFAENSRISLYSHTEKFDTSSHWSTCTHYSTWGTLWYHALCETKRFWEKTVLYKRNNNNNNNNNNSLTGIFSGEKTRSVVLFFSVWTGFAFICLLNAQYMAYLKHSTDHLVHCTVFIWDRNTYTVWQQST